MTRSGRKLETWSNDAKVEVTIQCPHGGDGGAAGFVRSRVWAGDKRFARF